MLLTAQPLSHMTFCAYHVMCMQCWQLHLYCAACCLHRLQTFANCACTFQTCTRPCFCPAYCADCASPHITLLWNRESTRCDAYLLSCTKAFSFWARTGSHSAAMHLERCTVLSSNSAGRAALLQKNESHLVHTHQAVLREVIPSSSTGSGPCP